MDDLSNIDVARAFVAAQVIPFFKVIEPSMTPEAVFPTIDDWDRGRQSVKVRIKFVHGGNATVNIDFDREEVRLRSLDWVDGGLSDVPSQQTRLRHSSVVQSFIQHVATKMDAHREATRPFRPSIGDLEAIVRLQGGKLENLIGQVEILRGEVDDLRQRLKERDVAPFEYEDTGDYPPLVDDWSQEDDDGGGKDGDKDMGVAGPS